MSINGANAVRAARRTFLSFLGGAAAVTLTPAAIATARPVDDDAEFIRLYRAFRDTDTAADLGEYREQCALREIAFATMVGMPVRTLAGLECKVEMMARYIGHLVPGQDMARWSEGALRDVRGMVGRR